MTDARSEHLLDNIEPMTDKVIKVLQEKLAENNTDIDSVNNWINALDTLVDIEKGILNEGYGNTYC